MPKKLILSLVIIIFFSTCRLAYASLLINEVMYDLSGSDSTNSKSREWVEIYNNGATDVVIDSAWRIYDGGANRTINDQNSFSISAGSYVILAGDKDTFLVDHAGFSGVVYDTGITTLSNTGATIKILDQVGAIVDSFSYTSALGGAGDGNSLQKISGSWSGASPTPGVTNETVIVPPVTPPSSGSSGSGSSSTSDTTTTVGGNGEDPYLKNKKEQKIQTKIIAKNFIFSGVPVELKAISTGRYGEVLPFGKYYWNFGDGDSKQLNLNEMEKFSHIYFYPGEYSINLEYYMNFYGENPDAVDKFTIKVLAPQVVISRVGDEKDFYIEITNNGDYDADISNWILFSDRLNFVLPKNTILNSKKKMIISPHISFFKIEDKNSLKLMTPQREVVYDYATTLLPIENFKPVIAKNSENDFISTKVSPKQEKIVEINNDNLMATPLSAESSIKNNKLYKFGGILVIFLGLTSGIVYFIRKQKIIPENGDDFELLDE